MSSALYLEHYLDSLENLPVELQRNFALMRDLDARGQNVMKDIDKVGDEYLFNIKMHNSDKKKEVMSEIKQMFSKVKEFSDDKVQLAIQTYELVDKHIRRLDSDLARFEAEIQDKSVVTTVRAPEEVPPVTTNKRGRKKIAEKESTKRKKIVSSEEEDPVSKQTKKKQKKTSVFKAMATAISSKVSTPVVPETTIIAATLQSTQATDGIDMPVDPNEPTYCLCNQVSYGEMIGCDNPDCPIEWFHFACVKLTTKPKGKWFCPKCISDRKKR